jgi:hypothetical protein
MNDQSKVTLLKDMVKKKRSLQATKNEKDQEIKSLRSEMDEIILEDGEVSDLKKDLAKVMTLKGQASDLRSRIKQINEAVDDIIMGEGDYDDAQMLITDMAGVE